MHVVAWDPQGDNAEAQLREILALHKANRSRLGPMPDAGFRDRARHNGLLFGEVDGKIAGYAMYDLPRSTLIKLVHICVSESARGSGLASALVDFAVTANDRRSLLAATCRADYGVDGFWQALGMHVASERRGRALSGSVLMNWVKRIHVERGLDLLESASLESGLPIAVLDTNVVFDLFSPPEVHRGHRDESGELQADWLQPLVSFVVSGEVDNEISASTDQTARAHLRAASQHLTRLSTLRPRDRRLEDAFLAATDERLLAADPSLRQDVLQLADAVHAGADYFVTNDGNVHLASQAWNLTEHGMQVVRPHELLKAVSPESFMTDFRSHLIDGGDLEWIDVVRVEPELEPAFRVYDREPRPNVFTQRLRDLLARTKTTRVRKLVDAQGRLWALVAFEANGSTLQVPLLRAIRGARGSTVAYQLLRDSRRSAWDSGASRIEITDGAISETLDATLRADGFSDAPLRSAALGPATGEARSLGLTSAVEVARAERHRWPLTVLGASLPTYIIPIQPRWATGLLGVDDGLLSLRRRGLGLSRELVYFSGTRIEPRDLPARILWYVTADKTTETRRIVARSMLIDSARLQADEARKRFGDVGVLRQSEIERAADNAGVVSVLRFEDTELLQRSVSRHHEVFQRYVKGRVFSMQHVDPGLFDDVVALQHEHAPTS